ncbi:hypothetical protein [Limnochorda sp.]|uniref:hypothetical protein n=1 Tax=Limnochorda sp. TaxID=1940279 RepID=UPI0039C1DD60
MGCFFFQGRFGQRERVLLLLAALVMALSFAGPLWSLQLKAPQYPEGLAMHVYAWKLDGKIDIINSLNHYIGMKAVKEDDFMEFRILPWIFGGAAGAFLIAAITRRRWVVGLTLLLLAPIFVFLLYDLYHWLWVYGNDLDPRAPITLKPFTPPMIGSHQVANFRTFSYFSWGTLLLAGALVLAALALWRSRPDAPREG